MARPPLPSSARSLSPSPSFYRRRKRDSRKTSRAASAHLPLSFMFAFASEAPTLRGLYIRTVMVLTPTKVTGVLANVNALYHHITTILGLDTTNSVRSVLFESIQHQNVTTCLDSRSPGYKLPRFSSYHGAPSRHAPPDPSPEMASICGRSFCGSRGPSDYDSHHTARHWTC